MSYVSSSIGRLRIEFNSTWVYWPLPLSRRFSSFWMESLIAQVMNWNEKITMKICMCMMTENPSPNTFESALSMKTRMYFMNC